MQCKTCRYYDEADSHEGLCKRYAPKSFLLTMNEPDELKEQQAYWPGVYAYDWCGEYVLDKQSKSLNEKINEE